MISRELLRSVCLECGADDMGVVELERDALAGERADILRLYPRARSVVTIMKALSRENVQSPAVNVANVEYKQNYEDVGLIARSIVKSLNKHGVRGVYSTYGFPADMNRWPAKPWDLAHKTIAVEAGLGAMGVNRLVLHPEHGAFISLNTLLIDAEVDSYDSPLEDNPCIDCMLCVSVCPTGSVKKDGFDFMGCLTHNYRDTMAGFIDWVETIVESKSARGYRAKFSDSESVAMWQSLTFGYSYKCSYCVSVCPAGKGPGALYEHDKKAYNKEIVRPLKFKPEPVYVIKGTNAEIVAGRNKLKQARVVRTPIRPADAATFLRGVELAFNPVAAEGVSMRAHFIFTGAENLESTVVIAEGAVDVSAGLHGKADLTVRADSETWVNMLGEQVSMPRAILSGKLKVSNPMLMKKFKGCLVI